MNTLLPYITLLIQGALTTLCAWLIVSVISICIGTVLGILSCHYLATPTSRACIALYTFISKGVPAYVQILIAYFVIPAAFGFNIPGFAAATMALAFCSSGYVTEIIRSAINVLPLGQWHACTVLGYPLNKALTRIILPQALGNSAPALLGELEQILKSTALFAAIGVLELTRAGMNVISRELNPVPVYITIACVYLLFSGCLQLIIYCVRKRNSQ